MCGPRKTTKKLHIIQSQEDGSEGSGKLSVFLVQYAVLWRLWFVVALPQNHTVKGLRHIQSSVIICAIRKTNGKVSVICKEMLSVFLLSFCLIKSSVPSSRPGNIFRSSVSLLLFFFISILDNQSCMKECKCMQVCGVCGLWSWF